MFGLLGASRLYDAHERGELWDSQSPRAVGRDNRAAQRRATRVSRDRVETDTRPARGAAEGPMGG